MLILSAIGFATTAIGLGIGGFFALLLRGRQKSIVSIYAICSGMILGLVSLEMMPESISSGGVAVFGIGFLAGSIIFFIIHQSTYQISFVTNDPKRDLLIRTSLLLTVSIAIHNLPMGFALGASYNAAISPSFLKALVLHNIPEGIAMITPMLLADVRKTAIISLILMVSIPVGLGAIIGGVIEVQQTTLWAMIINITIGIIVMVTIKEIFLEAIKQSSVLYSLAFGILGVGIVAVFYFFSH